MHNSNDTQVNNQTNKSSAVKLLLYKPQILIPIFITVILIWLAMFQLKTVLTDLGVMLEGKSWYARYPLLQAAAAAISVILFSSVLLEGLFDSFRKLFSKLVENWFLRIVWSVLITSVLIGFLFIFYGPYKYLNNGFFIRLLFAWMIFILFNALFMAERKFQETRLDLRMIFTALLTAFLITSEITFSKIDNNPLSASWSEGSVLYYATAFFSQRIYGTQIGLPVINPGRAILQSFAFLFPELPIAAHRVWDGLLWLGMPLLTGYALLKRLKIADSFQALSLLLFVLLFINIGPVYYHLLVIPLIILVGFRPEHFWRSLAAVVLASLWAGLTRINWYPFAGTLAAILFWLEIPVQPKLKSEIWKPAIWFTAGFVVSILSSRLYIRFSGTPREYFENPFSTPLLWERLLPTATNPLGILPAILLATLPALIFITINLFSSSSYYWIRRVGIFTLLAAFFLGGFLVSVRIGGGNNLHNFDAYLVILLVLMAYIFFKRIAVDGESSKSRSVVLNKILVGLLLILPLIKPIFVLPVFPGNFARDEFQEFLDRVEEDTRSGYSVLLVDEAHLIALDAWDNPPAPPEFNKVFLSEASITGNQAYLDAYYSALSSKKYDFIVAEPLSPYYYGSTHPFDKETDAWVEAVKTPTLCYYEVVYSFKELGLDYLAPRETMCEDLDLLP